LRTGSSDRTLWANRASCSSWAGSAIGPVQSVSSGWALWASRTSSTNWTLRAG
jgi:hypothetical protein